MAPALSLQFSGVVALWIVRTARESSILAHSICQPAIAGGAGFNFRVAVTAVPPLTSLDRQSIATLRTGAHHVLAQGEIRASMEKLPFFAFSRRSNLPLTQRGHDTSASGTRPSTSTSYPRPVSSFTKEEGATVGQQKNLPLRPRKSDMIFHSLTLPGADQIRINLATRRGHLNCVAFPQRLQTAPRAF